MAVAAVIAAAIAVTPVLAKQAKQTAQSFLTTKAAAKIYVSNSKASSLYLRKKAASNLYVAKATAPLPPVAAVAAGTAQFGPVSATTAGYIPSAFASFATKAAASPTVITFSGTATCTSEKGTAADACPVQILVDGQSTGKVNFAPATVSSATVTPAPLVHTITQTSVLTKGGHTVSVQYAGASKVTFTLKSWNLAVQAYPEPVEETETTTTPPTTATK